MTDDGEMAFCINKVSNHSDWGSTARLPWRKVMLWLLFYLLKKLLLRAQGGSLQMAREENYLKVERKPSRSAPLAGRALSGVCRAWQRSPEDPSACGEEPGPARQGAGLL